VGLRKTVIPDVAAEVPLGMMVAHLLAPVEATVTQMIKVHHDVLMTEKVGDAGALNQEDDRDPGPWRRDGPSGGRSEGIFIN
jgi:hypothetical protein